MNSARKWIAVSGLLLTGAQVRAEDKGEAPKPDKDGFYSLFDGKTTLVGSCFRDFPAAMQCLKWKSML